MKLKELGEFGFIERIKVDALVRLYSGLVGIGDDCALLKISPGMSALVTTDMLLERVHFLRQYMTPYQIGYKSLAVNLSDIAACGGVPKEAFVSIAVPEDVSVEELDEIYRGMKTLAREHEVNITGGDTTGSFADLVINIAVVGEVEPELARMRSTAQVGDWVCVTGDLGDSAAGLDIILNRQSEMDCFPELLTQHFLPRPHLKEGRLVARSGLAHAMMDISDGLASDIRQICRASKVGARLVAGQLPNSDSFRKYCRKFELDALRLSIGVGEDYCLLVTLPPGHFTALSDSLRARGCELHRVGEITSGTAIEIETADGEVQPLLIGGWDHFREKNI